MDNQVLNKYQNLETKEIKEIWETKRQYENHSIKFNLEWKQI